MLAKSKMDSCQHLGPDLRQNHKELKLCVIIFIFERKKVIWKIGMVGRYRTGTVPTAEITRFDGR